MPHTPTPRATSDVPATGGVLGRRVGVEERPDHIGVETPGRVAAVRASRLLDRGPEETFDRIAALAATVLSTPMAYLSIVDDLVTTLKGAPVSIALCGPDGTYRAPARDAACQLVVDAGVEVVVPDTAADPRLRDLVQVKQFGAASWIGVPVRGPEGHVFGNLCAMDTRIRDWTGAEIEGMRTLAAAVDDHIALRLAAQSLESYAVEATELARTLQQALLPTHAPRIPGVGIATRFSPGGTGTEVLGDFYDVVPSEGGFGVVIGDVCGKGPTAARTTALARSAVRTAAHSEPDPAVVLGTVNAVLLDWFGAGRSFVSAAYARFLRAGDGWDVRLASAGHPPGFVRHADGRVVELGAGGRVLGLGDEPPTGLDRIVLGPGDSLVLYTDGITEARDGRKVQFDEAGVRAAITALNGDADADRIADGLVGAALRHAGGRNADDVAVVVVQAAPRH
ncbi:PP2C family protein-serine/threonine phosphatase [Actinomycetospora atypica]|uniref:PP2C family protein-serine/threonine phosphatase n=1 Tax=Actinomycetospora atypica TaxID=1290095 RepID=A0ABV9YN56_9PSEU